MNAPFNTHIASKSNIDKTDPSIKLKLSHQEILKGLESGDESVLSYVYHQYVQDLFRFGCQFTSDRELVIDCIHEVFVAISSKQRRQNKIHSIKSYLFTATYRQIIYHLKRRKFSDIENRKNNLLEFDIELSVETRLILDESHREKLNKVKKAIKKISRKQRQAILHYYYDGFLHEEIAAIMGLKNTNSVAKLIARGLRAIKDGIITIAALLIVNAGPF